MIITLTVVQLIVTIALIGVILMQRSEGGGLGIGGGQGNMFSARGTANLLTRTTAVLAAIFMANCLLMGVLTSNEMKRSVSYVNSAPSSPVDTPSNTENPKPQEEPANGESAA